MSGVMHFRNDHLVAPALPEILYRLWPMKRDVTVVFAVNSRPFLQGHKSSRGMAMIHEEEDTDAILLNLTKIFGWYGPESYLWRETLWIALHEIGHFATWRDARLAEHEYEAHRQGYRRCEALASQWADRQLKDLACQDRRIFQPRHPGAYYAARLARHRDLRRQNRGETYDSQSMGEWRKYKSGGQFTTGEVCWAIGALRQTQERPHPRWSVIRRIAADLAFPYVDHAGRTHLLFAYGDLPEIKRRYLRAGVLDGRK